MKKAIALPEYADVKDFRQPEGVIDVQLDKVTNRLATPSCPDDYTIAFVAGTEPRDTCDQPSAVQGFFCAFLAEARKKAPPPPTTNGPTPRMPGTRRRRRCPNEQEVKKKKGIFGKIADAFRGGWRPTRMTKTTRAASKPAANGAPPP